MTYQVDKGRNYYWIPGEKNYEWLCTVHGKGRVEIPFDMSVRIAQDCSRDCEECLWEEQKLKELKR